MPWRPWYLDVTPRRIIRIAKVLASPDRAKNGFGKVCTFGVWLPRLVGSLTVTIGCSDP